MHIFTYKIALHTIAYKSLTRALLHAWRDQEKGLDRWPSAYLSRVTPSTSPPRTESVTEQVNSGKDSFEKY